MPISDVVRKPPGSSPGVTNLATAPTMAPMTIVQMSPSTLYTSMRAEDVSGRRCRRRSGFRLSTPAGTIRPVEPNFRE